MLELKTSVCLFYLLSEIDLAILMVVWQSQSRPIKIPSFPPRKYVLVAEIMSIANISVAGSELVARDIASRFPFPRYHLPCGDTSCDEALDSIKNWIDECSERHSIYYSDQNATGLPTRVLELTDDHFYLREDSSLVGSYACLSRCLGARGPPPQLRKENMAILKQGIPPNTFKDTVDVTPAWISFRWIDALCKIRERRNMRVC